MRPAPTALVIALLHAPAAASAVDTTLQVFDQQAYDTRIVPAFGSFVRLRDASPLKALLRETVRQLRSHPVPPRWGGGQPVNELSVALEILEGSAARDDRLLLERDGKPVARAEAIRHYVTSSVFPLLVGVICLVRVDGVLQELDLWNSDLAEYLYPRSRWIEESFDGMQPPDDVSFEFSTCEATGAIPPWFVDLFLRELRRVPRPAAEPELQREYDLLLRMLETVRDRPALRLVVEVC